MTISHCEGALEGNAERLRANVRFGSQADLFRLPCECPLSGVKRTSPLATPVHDLTGRSGDFGVLTDILRHHVRFTPESGHSEGSCKTSAFDPKRTSSADLPNDRFWPIGRTIELKTTIVEDFEIIAE